MSRASPAEKVPVKAPGARRPAKPKSTSSPRPKRRGERTKGVILAAANVEFSTKGFSGARMEHIAKRAKCNIRMLYQHFSSKEGLYTAVLESAYERIREKEQELHLETRDPVEGLLQLFDFTYTHFSTNPQFVQLVNNENLMKGKFILKSSKITAMTSPLRTAIEELLKAGIAKGLIRRDVDPVQLYATIAALSWFHLSNAYSLSAMFGKDLTQEEWRAERRKHGRIVIKSFLATLDSA